MSFPRRTLPELFRAGLKAGPGPDRILHPTPAGYRGISAPELESRVQRAAAGLAARGVKPGDRVALLSYNRPEWAIVDYACHLVGAVSVPLYSTSTADQVGFILSDAGAVLTFAEDAVQLAKVGGRPAIVFDPAPGVTSFESFLAASTGPAPSIEADETALATLIYTSGTTGAPKGVMLSHRNLVSNVEGLLEVVTFTTEDVSLSFLPVSHAFQRIVDYAIFARGAAVAYAESVDAVGKNILEVRPTILCAVPRFFEKVRDRVFASIEAMSPARRRLARWALRIGIEAAGHTMAGRRPPFWLGVRRRVANALVLGKISAKTGGRIRLLVSGSAPLDRETNEFFHALGFTLLEGYGLTETAPVITVNRPGDETIGTVGPPLRDVEVKLDPADGEILVRGPNVMMGYWNRPEETAASFTDGWLRTGDIGEFDAAGRLRITDRKKDLLKTSGGKYIAPAPIEARLRRHKYVANALVLGDRRKYAAALIVPDFALLGREFPGLDRAALVALPAVREEIQRHVDELNATLPSWESVKRFALLDEDFTIERGELTPTMKVRRKIVEEKRKSLIETLYR